MFDLKTKFFEINKFLIHKKGELICCGFKIFYKDVMFRLYNYLDTLLKELKKFLMHDIYLWIKTDNVIVAINYFFIEKHVNILIKKNNKAIEIQVKNKYQIDNELLKDIQNILRVKISLSYDT